MNSTAILLGVFLTCLVVSFFYWHVVRETLIIGIRFRLFARRDALRRLAVDGKEDSTAFAYCELEKFICKTIAVVPSISLASLVVSMIRDRNPISEDVERFRREASPRLVELLNKTVKDALYTMMLNSPILVTFGSLFALLLWIVGCFKKMLVYRQVEHLVDDLPSETTEPLPQPA
jgi:uncharacterized membrane protein